MADYASFLALGLDDGGEPLTGVSRSEVAWLLAAVPHFRVRRTLEVGFGLGFSAAALLHAGVRDHTTIEIAPERLPLAEANARKAIQPGQRLRILLGPSPVRLAQLQETREEVDLMLVDGGHRFDDAFVDAHFARSLVRPGGLLVLDDMQMNAIQTVQRWIETNLPHVWQPHTPPVGFSRNHDFGFAVYQRTDDPDGDQKPDGSRPWDRHRRFETFEDEN